MLSKKAVRCVALVTVLLGTVSCSFRKSLFFQDLLGNRTDNSSESEEQEPQTADLQSDRKIRLLNSREYRNAIRDVLGLAGAANLEFGSKRNGFDTSDSGQLDNGLLSALLVEGERLADSYVDERIRGEFSCFSDSMDLGCAATIVNRIGKKLFRRTLTGPEQSNYVQFYENWKNQEGVDFATKKLISRLLVSPNFLYKSELGTASEGSKTARLSSYEVASMIAFTLTASGPDEELLNDASTGSLGEEKIRYHVKRLLRTTGGRNQIVRFFKQWLKMEKLDEMMANPSAFAKLSGYDQAHALKVEFEMFVKSVILDGEGTLPALLTETFTYVNRHTAYLYGLESNSDQMEKVELDRSRRSGILTLASVMSALASSSDANRDRPVQRGTLIRERLFCTELGAPSGIDIVSASNNASSQVENFPSLTTREQFDVIMQQGEVCVSCHQHFMPYGYVLGNFNGMGAYVNDYFGRPINVAIEDVPMTGGKKSYRGPVEFINDMVNDRRVSKCFSKNVAKFITGAAGGEYLDRMTEVVDWHLRKKFYDFNAMLEEVLVQSFLYRRKVVSQ